MAAAVPARSAADHQHVGLGETAISRAGSR